MGLFDKIKGVFRMGEKELKTIFDINGVPAFSQFYDNGIYIWKYLYKGFYKAWHIIAAPTIAEPQRKRQQETLNAAKAVTSELAGLIWAEQCDVNVDTIRPPRDENSTTPEPPDLLKEFVADVLKQNNFNPKMREHIEQTMALGGGVLKSWYECQKDDIGNDILGTGKIKIGYTQADYFVPISWNNTEVTEAVFISRQAKNGYYYTLLEFHRWNGDTYIVENELYKAKNDGVKEPQDILGIRCPLDVIYPNLSEKVQIKGLKKSLFSYYRTAVANNLDDNSPLGISIYANALSTLKALDICYDSFIREFVLGKKRIIVPTGAIKTVRNPDTGTLCRYFDANDETYEALNADDMGNLEIKDNSVELRVEEHEAAINAFLAILSFQLGLSPGTLTFNRAEGLKTATEVISEKSKTYKTVTGHQNPIGVAIEKLVQNIIDIAILYEMEYKGKKIEQLVKPGYQISVFFDDSIINSREANINEGIMLLTNEVMSRLRFMTKVLGYTTVEAEKEIARIAQEKKVNTNSVIDFFNMGEKPKE
jgi:A118 family predicted phage portal protein